MKTCYLKIFTTLIFVLTSTIGHSQSTYYVATNGSNSNLGTESNPFLTIDKAIGSFGASGGTCFIKGGTYHEEISLQSLNNITIKAYANDYVIIDGTVKITSSWVQSSGNPNIYETTLTQDIWQLFINDERQVMARWPNTQFSDDNIYDHTLWAHGDSGPGSNGTMVDTGALAASGINAQGALAIANVGSFKTWTVNVNSHSTGSNTFTYDAVSGYRDKHHYYFLEGKIDYLDTENEWFYNPTTKKLSVWGNPIGKKIQGKMQSYTFDFDNCNNITIENLNFFATTLRASNATNITVNNCLFSYPSCSKRMLGDTSYPYPTELTNSNSNAITNFRFYQCLFEHTDGEAFYMNGQENIVEDCYIHHIDYTASSLRNLMTSLVNNGSNGTFTRNTMHTTGASATVYFVGSPTVSYNDISNTGLAQSDGSMVQITKVSVENSNVHHNWIHDSEKSGMRYDAPITQPEQAGKNGLAHHNVFWNLGKAMQIKGDEQFIYNNTCFDNDSNDISVLDEAYPDGSHSNEMTITRNNASDKISGHRSNPAEDYPVPGTVDHNKYSTTSTDHGIKALLQDPDNYDFRPKAGSELIDAGIAIPGITDGFTGTAPDAGAYERTDTWRAGTTWVPDFYPWSFLTLAVDDQILDKNQFQVYPVPARDILNIKSSHSIEQVAVFNLLGQQVLNQNKNTERINIAYLNNGIYILKIQTEDGLSITKKFIVQQ